MITVDQLSAAFKRKGFIMTDFNPFGIRRNDNINLWTDIRGLLRKVNGAWEIYQWDATTKPGKGPLLHPVNPEGCALWAEGQYINSHKLGMHNGHDALVQCANVKVYRINSKDGKIDITNLKPEIATPACGLNLHSVWCKEKLEDGTVKEIIGWDGVYQTVDNWSEGCQVISKPSNNKLFIDMAKASGLKWFNYSLLNINDIL